ncbi:hypothetical protein C8R47DRAFT_1124716 [Mycena vitilis]|nr:hypothetical protein C8R47DRAFT_1124716 [Mycena vitilis]
MSVANVAVWARAENKTRWHVSRLSFRPSPTTAYHLILSMPVPLLPPFSILSEPLDLPQELTDRIIDFVAGLRVKKLRANLAACSLVCRAWLCCSRYHFFQNCRLLVHLNNTLPFGKLLRSPTCTILPHLETLTLRNNGESVFHEIRDALKLLTNLKSLRLCGHNWAAHGAPPPREFLSGLSSVIELEIDCKMLGHFDHIVQTFCAIPSVTRLVVRRLGLPPLRSALATPLPCPTTLTNLPQLSSLLLDTPASMPIVHWLHRAGLHHLTALELSLPFIKEGHDRLPLQHYFQSLSLSLEHFTLSASHIHNDDGAPLIQDDFERVFEFGAFKNLHTCRFTNLFRDFYPSPLERAIPSIVCSIASPLQTLTFETESNAISSFSRMSWDALDQFLSEQENLRAVVFEIAPNSDSSTKYSYTRKAILDVDIEQAFLRVKSKGILHIYIRTRSYI